MGIHTRPLTTNPGLQNEDFFLKKIKKQIN